MELSIWTLTRNYSSNAWKQLLANTYFPNTLNPFQDEGGIGRGAKRPPYQFFLCNFQNFLAFSFNPFSTLVENFKAVTSVSPKLLNLNQEHLSKKCFFWSHPYETEVIIISLIEMLELPNFGRLFASTIQLKSHGKILLETSWTEIMTSYFKIPF